MSGSGRAVAWSATIGLLASSIGAGASWAGADGGEGWSRLSRYILGGLLIAEVARAAVFWSAGRPQAQPQSQGKRQARAQRPVRGRPRDPVKCAIFLPACAAAYFSLAVLFGAPALSSREETLALACLLTMLTALPTCLYAGADAAAKALAGAGPGNGPNGRAPDDPILIALRRSVAPTLAGAWCGATAIPLDWDRPWQAWPVPCFVGALVGCAASHLYTLVRLAVPLLDPANKCKC